MPEYIRIVFKPLKQSFDLGIFCTHTLPYQFGKSKISFVMKAVALNCSDLQILIIFLKYSLATVCLLNCAEKKKGREVTLSTPSNKIPVGNTWSWWNASACWLMTEAFSSNPVLKGAGTESPPEPMSFRH